MFSFFRKKIPAIPVDFSGLKTDMHSHLLPGIDDGSSDPEMSSILKKGLEDLGYQQFITTPHIMWDLYKNTPANISETLESLRLSGHHNIRAAAEYFMDDHFDELLSSADPLLCIRDTKVLVEFSFISPPMDLREKIFAMQMKGYQPILAHPERYEYMSQKKSMLDELKAMGCEFQMNLLSLTGYYGKIARELALYLVGQSLVSWVGTDLHHDRHLNALRMSKEIMPVVNRLLDAGTLRNPGLAV